LEKPLRVHDCSRLRVPRLASSSHLAMVRHSRSSRSRSRRRSQHSRQRTGANAIVVLPWEACSTASTSLPLAPSPSPPRRPVILRGRAATLPAWQTQSHTVGIAPQSVDERVLERAAQLVAGRILAARLNPEAGPHRVHGGEVRPVAAAAPAVTTATEQQLQADPSAEFWQEAAAAQAATQPRRQADPMAEFFLERASAPAAQAATVAPTARSRAAAPAAQAATVAATVRSKAAAARRGSAAAPAVRPARAPAPASKRLGNRKRQRPPLLARRKQDSHEQQASVTMRSSSSGAPSSSCGDPMIARDGYGQSRRDRHRARQSHRPHHRSR
jgi:hypothetical protein